MLIGPRIIRLESAALAGSEQIRNGKNPKKPLRPQRPPSEIVSAVSAVFAVPSCLDANQFFRRCAKSHVINSGSVYAHCQESFLARRAAAAGDRSGEQCRAMSDDVPDAGCLAESTCSCLGCVRSISHKRRVEEGGRRIIGAPDTRFHIGRRRPTW